MDAKDRLEVVRQDFASWRSQKRHSSEPIPEELWRKAIELLDSFPPSRLAVALKVTISNLQKRAGQFKGGEVTRDKQKICDSASKADSEVHLPPTFNITRIDLPSLPKPSVVELHFLSVIKDGCELRIPYDCPASFASVILAQFMGGPPS